MMGYTEAPLAWGRARGMARTVGVSLTDAVVQGWLSRAELAGMVEVCGRCPHLGECTDWLARTVTAPGLPGFCPNARAIGALMA